MRTLLTIDSLPLPYFDTHAKYNRRGMWLPGVVARFDLATGDCSVRFDDGQVQEHIDAKQVRRRAKTTLPLTPVSPANFASDKSVVLAAVSSCGVALRWVDPGAGAGKSVSTRRPTRSPPHFVAALPDELDDSGTNSFRVTILGAMQRASNSVESDGEGKVPGVPKQEEEMELVLPLDATTSELKDLIETRTGVPAEEQYLFVLAPSLAAGLVQRAESIYSLKLQDNVSDVLDEFSGGKSDPASSRQAIRLERLVPEREIHRYNLRSDRDVVLAAVASYGPALAFAGAEAQANREIVRIAATESWRALEYASVDIRSDSVFLCDLLVNGHAGKTMDGLAIQFCEFRALCVTFTGAAASGRGSSAEACAVADAVSASNRAMLLAAVKSNGAVLLEEAFVNEQFGVFAMLATQYFSQPKARAAIRTFVGELCAAALQEGGALDVFPLAAAFVVDEERRRFAGLTAHGATPDRCRTYAMVKLSYADGGDWAWPMLTGVYDAIGGGIVNGASVFALRLDEPLSWTHVTGVEKHWPAVHMVRDPDGLWMVGPPAEEHGVLSEAWLCTESPSAAPLPPATLTWKSRVGLLGLFVADDNIKAGVYAPRVYTVGDRVEAVPLGSHTAQSKPFDATPALTWLSGTVVAVAANRASYSVQFDAQHESVLQEIADTTARDVLRAMVLRGIRAGHTQPLDLLDLNCHSHIHSSIKAFFVELFHIARSAESFEDVVEFFFESELRYLCDAVERENKTRLRCVYPAETIYPEGREALIAGRRESFDFDVTDEECLEELDSIFVASLLGCSQGLSVLLERIKVRRERMRPSLALGTALSMDLS